MRFFRRGTGDDSAWAGVSPEDRAVVEQLARSGADLSELREVIFYSYAPSVEAGQAMKEEAVARGFAALVREPMPNYPGQWSVICKVRAVISPTFVRETNDYFRSLAGRHGAEYDGWEAAA
jgi:hypothetical protein